MKSLLRPASPCRISPPPLANPGRPDTSLRHTPPKGKRTWPHASTAPIELLAQDQAIYYDGAHTGHVLTYAQGREDAHTWADYINVGMEHGCVRHDRPRRVHARPRRRRPDPLRPPHARRSSSRRRSTAPTRRTSASTPGSSARSSAAACTASCCARPRRPTRCAPSSSPAATRTTSTASTRRCRRPLERLRGAGAPRARPARRPLLGVGTRGRGSEPTAAPIWGISEPRNTSSAATPGRSTRDGELLLGVKLESPEGVANCEEILAVPGLGFAELGPGDLSLVARLPRAAARPLPAGDAGGPRAGLRRLPQATASPSSKAARRTTSPRRSTRASGSSPATARTPPASAGRTRSAPCRPEASASGGQGAGAPLDPRHCARQVAPCAS